MPRLIILNGPPGIGKSTVARLYIEDHPMTLALEQDVVRGLLGGWRTRETESGTLARDLCVAMAQIHLLAGHDVVVPQFVANSDYLDRLLELGHEVAEQPIEFVLLDDVGSAERRFHARMNDPRLVEHQRIAAEFIEQAGGYAHQYARLARCLEDRDPVEVRSVEGDPDATYRAVLAHL